MSKKIGFLVAATASAWQPYKDEFEHELRSNGWTIGNGIGARDVFIDYEPKDASGAVVGAAGNTDTYGKVADSFVTNKVDVIVTAGTEAARACKSKTSSIPIVFASAGDPVRCRLVPSLKKPGGNVTGCSNMQTDQASIDARIKAMMTKMQPTPQKVAVIGSIGTPACPIDSALNLALSRLQNARVPAVQYPLSPADFQNSTTVGAAITLLKQQNPDVDVLLVCSDPLVSANMNYLIQAAHSKDLKLRTMHEFREPVDQHGGDRSHGPSFKALFSTAADMVDQILGGKSPGDIDVYEPQPNTFEDAPP